jgi:antitoxin component YwqK of YwqJK toxin-antitoxin module
MRYLLAGIIALLLYIPACVPSQKESIATESEIIDIWDNGRPKLIRLYAEIDGEREAIREITYYSDGSKNIEGQLLNGKRDGLWLSWYEDGSLWSEGQFTNGLRNGSAVVYYPNGQKMIEGQYKNNERVGIWRSWDDEGHLINESFMPDQQN